MYHNLSHIHFMGIGGIGMSGIAKILSSQGYKISGCDKDLKQDTIKELQDLGCTINENHCGIICQDKTINYLVYSSIINQDHPEINIAKKNNTIILKRASMLAELMRTKYSIAIGGSHGKTTTTSLIAHLLIQNLLDPTIIIGGKLKSINSNAQYGTGKFIVVEADESDKSIQELSSTIGIVTNIDLEHLDTFKNITEIKETFKKFLNKIPFYGKAIICLDDENNKELIKELNQKIITYAIDSKADIQAKNILLKKDNSEFDLFKNENFLGKINLSIAGKHNILNSLAAIALGLEIEIPFNKIQESMSNFSGVERRFAFHGTYKNAEIFDDYGHHPKEIDATLKVARLKAKNKLKVIFQPHRYSRTFHLWNDFIDILSIQDIDELIITDIFPAGEEPIPEINSENLVKSIINKNNNINIKYMSQKENFIEIKNYLKKTIEKDDLILFLGAGKVYELAKNIINL